MKTDEIIKILHGESDLKPDDYFDTSVFYYLAGRFPDLTIRQCTEIIGKIREDVIETTA